jgi:hypothetical protein
MGMRFLLFLSSRDKLFFDETLQNFIYKHTVDLENVLRNKKKEECTRRLGSSK